MASCEENHPPPTCEALEYLIHHIVLPKRLPQTYDYNSSYERTLLHLVKRALQALHHFTQDDDAATITYAVATISNLDRCRDDDGDATEVQLKSTIDKVAKNITLGAIPIEIKAQNAGVLITGTSHSCIFDFFELSPRIKAIANAKGRLIRDFPGTSSKICLGQMLKDGLQTSLSHTIATMTTQVAPDTQIRIKKGDQEHVELRDATDPRVVADLLRAVVTASGKPAKTVRITKNTRQEVLYKCGELAWIRSPLWLLVRVSLQLVFTRRCGDSPSPEGLYKAFMLVLLKQLLDLAEEHAQSLRCDLLHAIRAKLSRRVYKLQKSKTSGDPDDAGGSEESGESPWLSGVDNGLVEEIIASLKEFHSHRKQEWETIIRNRNANVDTSVLAKLQPEQHLNLDLPDLNHKISRMIGRLASREVNRPGLELEMGSEYPEVDASDLPPSLHSLEDEERTSHLQLYESWIEKQLDTWLSAHIGEKNTCSKLGRLIGDYFREASELYAGVPENMSVMYLTVLELWVACDKAACTMSPLLTDYDPEIELSEFQCLSLPFRNQLERLHAVEQYVRNRRTSAIKDSPSVICDFGLEESYAVRYFDTDPSQEHQILKEKVEADATAKQQAKCKELADKQLEHDNLKQRHANSTCDFEQIEPAVDGELTEPLHSRSCARCGLEKTMNDIEIDIYEWPLHPALSRAKATVFELQPPVFFTAWRDTTLYVLTDILRFRGEEEKAIAEQYTLPKHKQISQLLSTDHDEQRIKIMSTKMPHEGTHFKPKKGVNLLSKADVCVNNDLHYSYYDCAHEIFVKPAQATEEIVRQCTYNMPEKSVKLESYISKPPSTPDGLPHNEILSKLSDCPTHFSIEEFKAFSTMPLGKNIVYTNILGQLAMPVIDFTKVETQCLILQVVNQTSEYSAQHLERTSHTMLKETTFCLKLLAQLRTTFQRLGQNSESWRAVAILVVLTRRLVTLTTSPDLRSDGLNFLAEVRRGSFRWVNELKQRADNAMNDKQRQELLSGATVVALLCLSTFDVEEHLLPAVLTDHSVISTLIQCSIMVQLNHSLILDSEHLCKPMVLSWRTLMFRIFPTLSQEILKNNDGLNNAIAACWAEYKSPSISSWTLEEKPKQHWIRCSSDELPVHFNLITAELLVDGRPLARLPSTYMNHAMYKGLLAESSVNVGPSRKPGMEFSSVHAYHGHNLHFGMVGSDMLLLAVTEDTKLDLLPPRVFADHLPNAFVSDFKHFYNHNTNEVEFRPKKYAWNPEKSGDTVTYSRQYQGYTIDSNQNPGTLIGLSSKLVLLDPEPQGDRMVLIPEGDIKYTQEPGGDHVTVSIGNESVTKVHTYSLDTIRTRIIDAGDMQGKLFLAYLHALTSHCLPDPFTKRTGTESALDILRSAAVLSFEKLTSSNIRTLCKIAQIAPRRSYWPPGLPGVQSIKWDSNLPVMSQHNDLFTSVKTIFDRSETTKALYRTSGLAEPANDIRKWMYESEHSELVERDSIGTSKFHVSGFGGEHFTTEKDVYYNARDRNASTVPGQRAFLAARMIWRDSSALNSTVAGLEGILFERYFCGSKAVHGAEGLLDPTFFRYDPKYLGDPSVELRDLWCSLHLSFIQSPERYNVFDVMAFLATTAFAKDANIDAVQTLCAFYKCPDLATIDVPAQQEFYLTRDTSKAQLKRITDENKRGRGSCPESQLSKGHSETSKQYNDRKGKIFGQNQRAAFKNFTTAITAQWEAVNVVSPDPAGIEPYLDLPAAMNAVKILLIDRDNNDTFKRYLRKISSILSQQKVVAISAPSFTPGPLALKQDTKTIPRQVDMHEIFEKNPSDILDVIRRSKPDDLYLDLTISAPPIWTPQTGHRLQALEKRLISLAETEAEHAAVKKFSASCVALEVAGSKQKKPGKASLSDAGKALPTYFSACKQYLDSITLALTQFACGQGTNSRELAFSTDLSPRLSPTLWLGHLVLTRFESLDAPWKKVICEYALAIIELHRAQKLLHLLPTPSDLAEELSHVGHKNWDPQGSPETLLLEAESGIRIKDEQERIAQTMRSPPDSSNSVVQLLMGKGKSSTIIPIVAAALADGKRLVRVIVGRAQHKQMVRMLMAKLGGLLNRRIYFLSISRRSRLSVADADAIRAMCEECMANRGIMLLQPEHILSFRSMGIAAKIQGNFGLAKSLLGTQSFFYANSRDILDEVDKNLNIQNELIYTMGNPRLVEGGPDRWSVQQEILGLVPDFATRVKAELPQSVDIQQGCNGSFPRIRILKSDAADRLVELLATHVLEHGLPGIPLLSQPPRLRQAITKYISQPQLGLAEIEAVEKSTYWTETTRVPLLVARGLIACRLLTFILESKRYRVNYGLDPTRKTRTRTAVPFRAKDTPSSRSEFRHPDIIILLTLSCYYIRGLTDDELFDAFTHLLNSDQAEIQYRSWVSAAGESLPVDFRLLAGISIRDQTLCVTQVFPHMRFSRAAIDYYVSNLVFLKELRVYPQQITGSACDLAEDKAHPTTGFSGTHDSAPLLPTGMKQANLDDQAHTDAEVLGYLLKDETLIALLPTRTSSTSSDAEHLLHFVDSLRPERVPMLLDAGAQVLDRSNKEVAQMWLEKNDDNRFKGAVYFEGELLSVIDRTGFSEALYTSPYAKQLNRCLVYIDDGHTRGTDLQLPRSYRAVVTLGAGLTTDELRQTCLRLRRFGRGQSVTLVIPEDVSVKIRELNKLATDDAITVLDVLTWCAMNTSRSLKRGIVNWAKQAHRHELHKHLLNGSDTTHEQAQAFLENEDQSLGILYGPTPCDVPNAASKSWDIKNKTIAAVDATLREFGVVDLEAAPLNEETERELDIELQQERQVQRPPKMQTNAHKIHPHIWKMVTTGKLLEDSDSVKPVFQTLAYTSAAKLFGPKAFPTGVLATQDFLQTVKNAAGTANELFVSDPFLRSVQYVVSLTRDGKSDEIHKLVILSPFEANNLLKDIRKSAKVTLHLYAPCHNASYTPLDKLELWHVGRKFVTASLPQTLRIQLELFAGSLYLRSYQDYLGLCDHLGLLRAPLTAEQQVNADGFIVNTPGKWGLEESPVPFLRKLLLKVRREGEGAEKTHLGRILQGQLLDRRDFEADQTGGERLRGITPEVAAEFEEHARARRSRSVEESLFVSE